jgi:glucose-6-phosphate-specific signal transduction histidine kinase
MQKLMIAITGKVVRNSTQFYEMLASDQYKSRYKKAKLEGQMVYFLPDGTAWMFTKTDILFRMKNYIHISATDVSKSWELTSQLQLQDQRLRDKSNELKETIANLHTLSKQKELENAKMRAHDILGQRLTVLVHALQAEHHLDDDLITSLSKGLLDELKANQSEIMPGDEIKSIQKIFAAIGVDIHFNGELPENNQQASLLVDIIREGSTNAVRHGFATQINIKTRQTQNAYNLTITNNGYVTTTPITPGSGIGVMRKKVDAQGGFLEIIPHPLFTLSVDLPGGELYE